MNNIQLANSIKLLCKSRKVTVKDLLENCKINRNFMYDLEKKAQAPSIDKLCAIADYLDCSIDYLIGKTDSPEATQPSSGIQQDSASSRMPAAGSYGMTSAEKELIRAYRQADSISQAMVLRALSLESPAAEKESGA